MATSELSAKGTRAYAVYATVHLMPGLVLEHLTKNLFQADALAWVVGALSWTYALVTLSNRFFKGEGRIPVMYEIRGIALKAAWNISVGLTILRLLWPGFSTPQDITAYALVGAFLLTTTFVAYLAVFLIFLLPFVQEQLFAAWSRRNP